MFCSPEQIENNFSQMSCEESMLQEILAMISLVFSLFVITISVKKLKKNLMNILIIQILISEMIDEINIILNIFTDVQGPVSFENYHGRMVFCYSQIFIAVFSCLWTLTASFFISFKLYDIIMNKNKIYSDGSFMSKYTPLISIICPGIVSYIIWFIQILAQSGQFDFEKTYEKSKRAPPKHFRMGFCWVYTGLSVAIFVIASILIFGSFYFSLYKGFCFIKKTSEKLRGNNDERRSTVRKKLKNMKQIQNTLFLYPTVACVLWIIFFALKFYFRNKEVNERTGIVMSWIFSFFISIRQFAYTLVCFLTQPKLIEYAYQVITFKACRGRGPSKNGSISSLNSMIEKAAPILQESEKNETNENNENHENNDNIIN